ncbi:hypothetical protein F503_00194 [Ophiostoma piceae UAMH 11346]|uniref:Uncharacterized protein n=1 Tax=Ophiostoma piceae (strain UAMH 11346) TaxID=1262450 RepID=S3CW63_OPHP1|nr:hypothetical protein F503_00194 [Ophiostoma piceae UAMH 11346]
MRRCHGARKDDGHDVLLGIRRCDVFLFVFGIVHGGIDFILNLRGSVVGPPYLATSFACGVLGFVFGVTFAGSNLGGDVLDVLDSGVLDSGILDGGILDGGILDSGILDSGILDGGILDGGIINSRILSDGLILGAVT